jgi:hypothetical protein
MTPILQTVYSVGNALDSYSADPRFEFWHANTVFWLRFSWISSVPPGECWIIHHFLQNPSQFVGHLSHYCLSLNRVNLSYVPEIQASCSECIIRQKLSYKYVVATTSVAKRQQFIYAYINYEAAPQNNLVFIPVRGHYYWSSGVVMFHVNMEQFYGLRNHPTTLLPAPTCGRNWIPSFSSNVVTRGTSCGCQWSFWKDNV